MTEFQSPRKRPRPVEFEDIESIDKVSDGYGAKIHGVVTAVSPIKGRNILMDSLLMALKNFDLLVLVQKKQTNSNNLQKTNNQLHSQIAALKMQEMVTSLKYF